MTVKNLDIFECLQQDSVLTFQTSANFYDIEPVTLELC